MMHLHTIHTVVVLRDFLTTERVLSLKSNNYAGYSTYSNKSLCTNLRIKIILPAGSLFCSYHRADNSPTISSIVTK